MLLVKVAEYVDAVYVLSATRGSDKIRNEGRVHTSVLFRNMAAASECTGASPHRSKKNPPVLYITTSNQRCLEVDQLLWSE